MLCSICVGCVRAPVKESVLAPEESDCAVHADASSCGAARAAGCVFEHVNGSMPAGTCRAVSGACEEVIPASVEGAQGYRLSETRRVTFAQGDPCGVVDPTCSFDVRGGVCERFVAVTACPETIALARTLEVSCDHPEQPELTCVYPHDTGRRVRMTCAPMPSLPPGIKRRPREPNIFPARSWNEQVDYDRGGCPMTRAAWEEPCEAPPTQECMHNERLAMFVCQEGRWEQTRRVAPPG